VEGERMDSFPRCTDHVSDLYAQMSYNIVSTTYRYGVQTDTLDNHLWPLIIRSEWLLLVKINKITLTPHKRSRQVEALCFAVEVMAGDSISNEFEISDKKA
jgi:hypothetical protein